MRDNQAGGRPIAQMERLNSNVLLGSGYARRPDGRVAHAVSSGLDVAREAPFKGGIRIDRHRKVVPAEG